MVRVTANEEGLLF